MTERWCYCVCVSKVTHWHSLVMPWFICDFPYDSITEVGLRDMFQTDHSRKLKLAGLKNNIWQTWLVMRYGSARPRLETYNKQNKLISWDESHYSVFSFTQVIYIITNVTTSDYHQTDKENIRLLYLQCLATMLHICISYFKLDLVLYKHRLAL